MQSNSFNQVHRVLATYVPNVKQVGSYKLDRMQALMDFLGNPQDALKIVHVAGTSGKTSTCYYAASLLREAGFAVGLTVSPHVKEVNERLQINLTPIPEKAYCLAFSKFIQLIQSSGIKPSYFELLVAFAYWYFAEANVDYAVVEVGLGGLLDGTNVIDRQDKVCIITDIGLDHINVLGNTIAEIAAQKAGIIQKNNIVFTHEQSSEILSAFKRRVLDYNATLRVVDDILPSSKLDFLPLFQQHNFTLAKAAIDYILKRDNRQPLTEKQLIAAASISVPARMEEHRVGKKTVIFDGAHNEQKITALGKSLNSKYGNEPIAALVSFVDGRSFRLESSLNALANFTDNLIITAFVQASQDLPYGPVDPKQLAELARQQGIHHINVEPNPKLAYKKLLTQPEPILLVTGSFYLMEDLRP